MIEIQSGSYPKIGTVIEADLWRFGQLRGGSRVRFRTVDRNEASAALGGYREDLAGTRRSVSLATGQLPPSPT